MSSSTSSNDAANVDAEDTSISMPSDLECQLLEDSDPSDSEGVAVGAENYIAKHDILTAPLMTREAYLSITRDGSPAQYGVLGKVLASYSRGSKDLVDDQRLYLNTNAPFSALICGVQGSGKSHTVSTILENMLIPNFLPIGSSSKALSGLVLHYGDGGVNSLPSEAAWLSTSLSSHVTGVPVKVYVSRASFQTMTAVYSRFGTKVTVKPLYFQNSELDAAAILSMMAVGSTESAPLYMQIILSILRDLGENFTFTDFMKRLDSSKQKFNPAQLAGLEQRLMLLTAFLEPAPAAQGKKTIKQGSRFSGGHLTIIDLSDPFLDAASACGLFEIIVRLFIRADVGTGKVLVVDEAHKYLLSDRSSTGLTKSLLNLIRQQRHLAMRVIISTQEPTVVPPVLLDLCSVTIIHRFSSPTWWQHLIQHVPTDFSDTDAFDKVVKLQTGHAIILAPSGLMLLRESGNGQKLAEGSDGKQSTKVLTRFGRRYLIVKTRKRVTADGGASILVLHESE
ncbi:hypothetical protein BDN70DRAFT_873074 [Pholiota conissans]|uniref:Zona occludens toxin N-terminal domain-containing protein n=1 Tax=Pholiota conissans TaxID=109636 RepID=A0A9P5ZA65_9AGAR|nr:hypothetical protein BDN70DRAFT_873074 [Pholiota conissans]